MQICTKISIALHCLAFIHRYGDQMKVTSSLLSKSTGVNPVVIRGILSALKRDGMISVRRGTGGASLIADPGEITVYMVCRSVDPDAIEKTISVHRSPSRQCPIGRGITGALEEQYSKLREAVRAEMMRMTLADVMAGLGE